MILDGSRYANVGIYEAVNADGQTVRALRLRFTPNTPPTSFYTVVGNDRLDLLAYNFYRAADRFWLIADANGAIDPEDLVAVPGRRIGIPPDRT